MQAHFITGLIASLTIKELRHFCFFLIFLLLNKFITFIGVQQSSQPIFTACPSQTLSPSPQPPHLSHLETISFSKSVRQYLFCKEVHSVLFSDSTCQ